MGVVAPASGFTFVADLCRREGALLISDEVLTGSAPPGRLRPGARGRGRRSSPTS
jgi:glutamate-1-semialdehyde aminotransferase